MKNLFAVVKGIPGSTIKKVLIAGGATLVVAILGAVLCQAAGLEEEEETCEPADEIDNVVDI